MKRVYMNTQPLFIPAIYMVARMVSSDRVVLLEEAQYHKKGHHSYTQLSGANGEFRHSLPVKKASFKPINEVELAFGYRSLEEFRDVVEKTYCKTPEFHTIFEELFAGMSLLDTESVYLKDVNRFFLDKALIFADAKCSVVAAHDLVPDRPKDPSKWMALIGHMIGASEYLCGEQAYLNDDDFHAYGIKKRVQDYYMYPYKNLGPVPAYSGLGFVDALFNLGVSDFQYLVRGSKVQCN